MTRTVSVVRTSFEKMRQKNNFLVDKTSFISDWWNADDYVTLICRPRRFGKTLTLSMVERFLSNRYNRDETMRLFEGLEVSRDPEMMALMGTVPVVFVTLADVKDPTLREAVAHVKQVLCKAVRAHRPYLLASDAVDDEDKAFLRKVSDEMEDLIAKTCLQRLCDMLIAHWKVEPVVLLDEYDTPLVRAWEHGFWDDMVTFVGGLFNSTFKTNPSLGCALITGITRVAQESIFSDMNNPAVVTTTTPMYETDFGFTQAEVDAALAEYGLSDRSDEVRRWYDGFTFGDADGIYNPWSITNYLKYRKTVAYWANTSSNELVSHVVRAHVEIMHDLEELIRGGSVTCDADERVTFSDLDDDPDTVWSLLLAAGYLRAKETTADSNEDELELVLTNHEIKDMFRRMVRKWFGKASKLLGPFARALVDGDADTVQERLSLIVLRCASGFDSGTKESEDAGPERFWHGLVLGMATELLDNGYDVRSNLESGLGRLDVTIIPSDPALRACVLEFKVSKKGKPDAMERACADALGQIERKRYDEAILSRGVEASRISHFGIAFHGKIVLVRGGNPSVA